MISSQQQLNLGNGVEKLEVDLHLIAKEKLRGGMVVREVDRERFVKKLKMDVNSGCWEWTASGNGNGYGTFTMNGKKIRAHRFAFLLVNGQLPQGKPMVLHHCDNRACCNPEHLFAGDADDNGADMSRKGRAFAHVHPDRVVRGDKHGRRKHPERFAKGSRVGGAKLTEAIIPEIRLMSESGMRYKDIALQFGVHHSLIGLIRNRKIWKHVK